MTSEWHCIKSSPTSISSLLSFDLSKAFEKAPGVKEKAVFASKLAALVGAGLPIVLSLDLIASQQKLPMFKRALTQVSLDVNEGGDPMEQPSAAGPRCSINSPSPW